MAEVSNIDDMLMGGKTDTQPATPESNYDIYEDKQEEVSYDEEEPSKKIVELDSTLNKESAHENDDDKNVSLKKESEYDDYGNAKTPPKTYTEEEVNERINKAIRDRLARGNTTQHPSQQQVQQATQDFEYNPESNESWQAQLEKFVEGTVIRMGQKQSHQQQAMKEHQVQAEFETKFTNGMERFNDFRDVVSSQPITDPMTYALRGMKDPAAFIYAASKRNPTELQRIAQIGDPYAQMVEMGKLEERMRKSPQQTKAPRPIGRTRDDASIPIQEKSKEPTIEDLIAKSEVKKRALLTSRRGRG